MGLQQPILRQAVQINQCPSHMVMGMDQCFQRFHAALLGYHGIVHVQMKRGRIPEARLQLRHRIRFQGRGKGMQAIGKARIRFIGMRNGIPIFPSVRRGREGFPIPDNIPMGKHTRNNL